jgi:predicted dinucleotide-binding enzyme
MCLCVCVAVDDSHLTRPRLPSSPPLSLSLSMARNLLSAGHSVTVLDTDRDKMEQLWAMGAVPAGSVKQLAQRCDVVITMVRGVCVMCVMCMM